MEVNLAKLDGYKQKDSRYSNNDHHQCKVYSCGAACRTRRSEAPGRQLPAGHRMINTVTRMTQDTQLPGCRARHCQPPRLLGHDIRTLCQPASGNLPKAAPSLLTDCATVCSATVRVTRGRGL
eukprot:668801-Hanusia_phi.AAC.1